MDDRELLELAAKAAGVIHAGVVSTGATILDMEGQWIKQWDPLEDDGEALRLAVSLGLNIIQMSSLVGPDPIAAASGFGGEDYRETSHNHEGAGSESSYIATRRAIVLAAAKIGESLEAKDGD